MSKRLQMLVADHAMANIQRFYDPSELHREAEALKTYSERLQRS